MGSLQLLPVFVGKREQSLKKVKKMEVRKWECGGRGVGHGGVVFQVWI